MSLPLNIIWEEERDTALWVSVRWVTAFLMCVSFALPGLDLLLPSRLTKEGKVRVGCRAFFSHLNVSVALTLYFTCMRVVGDAVLLNMRSRRQFDRDFLKWVVPTKTVEFPYWLASVIGVVLSIVWLIIYRKRMDAAAYAKEFRVSSFLALFWCIFVLLLIRLCFIAALHLSAVCRIILGSLLLLQWVIGSYVPQIVQNVRAAGTRDRRMLVSEWLLVVDLVWAIMLCFTDVRWQTLMQNSVSEEALKKLAADRGVSMQLTCLTFFTFLLAQTSVWGLLMHVMILCATSEESKLPSTSEADLGALSNQRKNSFGYSVDDFQKIFLYGQEAGAKNQVAVQVLAKETQPLVSGGDREYGSVRGTQKEGSVRGSGTQHGVPIPALSSATELQFLLPV